VLRVTYNGAQKSWGGHRYSFAYTLLFFVPCSSSFPYSFLFSLSPFLFCCRPWDGQEKSTWSMGTGSARQPTLDDMQLWQPKKDSAGASSQASSGHTAGAAHPAVLMSRPGELVQRGSEPGKPPVHQPGLGAGPSAGQGPSGKGGEGLVVQRHEGDQGQWGSEKRVPEVHRPGSGPSAGSTAGGGGRGTGGSVVCWGGGGGETAEGAEASRPRAALWLRGHHVVLAALQHKGQSQGLDRHPEAQLDGVGWVGWVGWVAWVA